MKVEPFRAYFGVMWHNLKNLNFGGGFLHFWKYVQVLLIIIFIIGFGFHYKIYFEYYNRNIMWILYSTRANLKFFELLSVAKVVISRSTYFFK